MSLLLARTRFFGPLVGLGVALASLAGCGREALFESVGGGGTGGSAQGGGGTGGGGCVPATEVCNGADDNCNGQVDEGCSCSNGETQECYSGPAETAGVGPCKKGSQLCQDGGWGDCEGEVTPDAELCDGADNDCDGQVDQDNPGGGDACTLGLPGACGAGITKCLNGAYVCSQVVTPKPEVCDGVDNNCNGQIDDGITGVADCSTGLPGVCDAGKVDCTNGAAKCAQVVMPSPELCDTLDNNCNGAIDEGNPAGGVPCDTGLPGACSAGVTACNGGALTCNAVQPPGNEVCDGKDNDCDGTIDDVADIGTLCNTGSPAPCNQGTLQCQGAALVCAPSGNGAPETCDGADDNCNGQIDEGNPGGGGACMTGSPGVCGPGTLTCQGGAFACIPDAAQGSESCSAAGDEDCDGASATVFFTETFADDAAGWMMDAEWQIGAAKASMGNSYGNPDPAADHTAGDDNGIAGVVIGGNASTMQHPYRWLTSPLIPVDAGAPAVYLQFWRWLNSDYAPWMTNRVEVFDAAANMWTLVWQSGNAPGVIDPAWTKQVYDITSKAKGGTIRVRFGFNVGAGGAFTVSQWNVDDVVVTTEPCD